MLDLELQKFLFNAPERVDLMNYAPKSNRKVRIGVYRNHSFELVEHIIAPYLDFANLTAEFVYSDYDDSLSFLNLDMTIDCLILWLDTERYHIENVADFLKERIRVLKSIYKKNVLVALFGKKKVDIGNEVLNFSFESYVQEFGDRLYDLRLEPFAGTKLSSKASMMVARELGLKYIPALVSVNLKAIILDLDNTLYKGVLGEDGYEAVELTSGHERLQKTLKTLKEQGFFLCIMSKNEQQDVCEMFKKRLDFPLHLEDFSTIKCSWESKGSAILAIAKELNIGTDSMLFVDDNPGELMSVYHVVSDVNFLLAQEDADKTVEILNTYPGLMKTRIEYEDSIRAADAKANEKRNEMKQQLSPEDYIQSLKMKLVFALNHKEQMNRASELANKTNQFIFNYKRYSTTEIEDLMMRTDAAVVTVKLSDALSDSGIICVCVAEKVDDYANITECLVSCRALGRGIDEIIVKGAIEVAKGKLGVGKVRVNFQKGPRNLPAEKFVETKLRAFYGKSGLWNYEFPNDLVEIIEE